MPRRSTKRERRIDAEILVDTYGAEERALGWYYYVESRLAFPFPAMCMRQRSVSPLTKGERVEVLGMAAEDDCRGELFVSIRWGGRRLAVPLAQLQPMSSDADTLDAVADWHYWVARGYEF
jgi:hypothetical protein